MPDYPPVDLEKLRLADVESLKESLAFALNYSGRKRVHDADQFMARIVADRLARHLADSGFVIMKKPPSHGHSNLARGPHETE